MPASPAIPDPDLLALYRATNGSYSETARQSGYARSVVTRRVKRLILAEAAANREKAMAARGIEAPLAAADVAAAPLPEPKSKRQGPVPIDPRTGEEYKGRVGLIRGTLNGGHLAAAETYDDWMRRRAAKTATAAIVYAGEPSPHALRRLELEAEGLTVAEASRQAHEELRA